MDADLLAPLLTPEGWAFLESLPPYDESQALTLGSQLRTQGHSPELISAALTQQRLRQRAASKFGPFAQRMLFTPDGLEQATRLTVSAHHARRYAQAGCQRVADLGCGLGGDALALSGLDIPVLAVELDEATAALTTVNLMPFPQAQVVCGDALEVDLKAQGVDAVFADPARRRGGKRLLDPEQWSPRLSQILHLRSEVDALGVKIAPGTDYAALPQDAQVQWVSVDGGVLEADIWCGPLAPEGPGRSALIIRDDSFHLLADPENRDPSFAPLQLEPATELGQWLHEPDGAAIRAGLVAHLAQRLQAAPVAPRIAYLTGDTAPDAELAPFVRSWRVKEVLPMNLKALKKRVASNDIGRLDIHKRGVEIAPEQLRRSVRPRGSQTETWVVTRAGAGASPRGVVLVVE